jgi:DNA-binding transcriptional regulator YiaG
VRPADLALATTTIGDLATGHARRRREQLGVRQADIAAVIGVTRQCVSQWESGIRRPTAAHALAYAKILHRLGRQSAA